MDATSKSKKPTDGTEFAMNAGNRWAINSRKTNSTVYVLIAIVNENILKVAIGHVVASDVSVPVAQITMNGVMHIMSTTCVKEKIVFTYLTPITVMVTPFLLKGFPPFGETGWTLEGNYG